MTPVEMAADVYRREPCARSFREDLEAHLLHGWVFSLPDLFVMGRTVRQDAPHAEIVDPWRDFPAEECDAWLVYLAAGNLAKMWPLLPFRKKFIGWERGNVLRWHKFESLAARFGGLGCRIDPLQETPPCSNHSMDRIMIPAWSGRTDG